MAYFKETEISSPLDLFGNVTTAQRTDLIELKSTYGLSDLRDITEEVGGGTVTNVIGNGEYTLATSSTTGSRAALSSAERGRYVPGTEGEVGIGLRFPTQTFTGTAFAEWGFFDTDNGFGFGIDADGSYVFTKRDGAKTKVRQADWNVDTLDGNGKSGVSIDLQDGTIYQIDFVWYGYGDIVFRIYNAKKSTSKEKLTAHIFNPENQTSVLDPNLPIKGVIDNGNTTTDYVMYVAGRQYSIIGNYTPSNRINSEERLQVGSVDTSFVPILSFRKKSDFKSVSVKLEGLDVTTTAKLVYKFVLNGTLTGASFGTPSETTASETACDSDVSATSLTGGIIVSRGIIPASGIGTNATGSLSTDLLRLAIPEEQPLTLLVKRVTGTGATVDAVVRWREEW